MVMDARKRMKVAAGKNTYGPIFCVRDQVIYEQPTVSLYKPATAKGVVVQDW